MDINLKKDENRIREDFFALSSNRDIAALLEVPVSTLIYYVYRLQKEKQYKEFHIPKRNGKVRTINAPASNLKILQQKLNKTLQLVYVARNCSFAYTKNSSSIKNARAHVRSKVLVKIDLMDFFDQIHFGRIRGVFMAPFPFNFNKSVASTLSNICVYNSRLPQGAPTSPIISNMICWAIDRDLQRFCKKLHCVYTRYADDITISTTESWELPEDIAVFKNGSYEPGEKLKYYLDKHKFVINQEKFRVLKPNNRQLVTGLVTNEFANVKRAYVHHIRHQLSIWEKEGLKGLADYTKRSTNKDIDPRWSLLGKLNYLRQVRGSENTIYKKLRRWYDYLALKERYLDMEKMIDAQKRGLLFEAWFKDLLRLNKVDAHGHFTRRIGNDKIDGWVFLAGQHFITECKWADTDGINQEIKAFRSDIEDSGKGTRGIFVSVNGWNKEATPIIENSSNKDMFLINGDDLKVIVANRDLPVEKLLLWKLGHFSVSVQAYRSAEEFWGEYKKTS